MGKAAETLGKMLKDNLGKEGLLDLAREINSYDGSFEDAEWYDFEDAAEFAESTYEFGRAIVYGNVTSVSQPVRYDVYGNLYNVSAWEIEQEIWEQAEDLAGWLLVNGADAIRFDFPAAIESFVEAHRGES